MRKKWFFLALFPLLAATGGLVYSGVDAAADTPDGDSGYVCPLTGEELPCPKCCPLN